MSHFSITLGSEADKMLRGFIAGLAEKAISSKVYSGPEHELSIFLAGHIYNTMPREIYDQYKRDEAKEALFKFYREEAAGATGGVSNE